MGRRVYRSNLGKMEINNVINASGVFTIEHYRDGKLINKIVVNNVVTNVGKSRVADLIGDVNSINPFGYIAIGSGSTAESASDNSLEYELKRAAASKSLVTTTVSNDTLRLEATFNFGSGENYAICEAGVFNAATGGDMLCRKTFPEINVQENDSLTITYDIQVS